MSGNRHPLYRADIVQGRPKARCAATWHRLSLDHLARPQPGTGASQAFAQTFSRHLSRVDWTLPAALGQIAEALNLTSSQNASEMLMRKAFALSVWESLMTNLQQAASPVASARTSNRRASRCCSGMKSGRDDPDRIAATLGMSVSTLQRAAKKSWA